MPTVVDYLALVTSWHRAQPKFSATVAETVRPISDLQAAAAAFPAEFDLDAAIGAQLDVIGEWVGRSRNIPVPLQGLYFSFSDPIRGFCRGIWKGPYDTAFGISQLDDDTYRRLLRAKIASNSWDGTVPGAQAILDAFFTDPETFVFVQDNGQVAMLQSFFTLGDPLRGFGQGSWKQPGDTVASVPAVDMSLTIGVAGKLPPISYLALLGRGYIPVKPAGVTVNYAVTSVDRTPLFGFGLNSAVIKGFGQGSWAETPDQAIAHPL